MSEPFILPLTEVSVVQIEAAQSAGGVSAFSKELNKLHKPSEYTMKPVKFAVA